MNKYIMRQGEIDELCDADKISYKKYISIVDKINLRVAEIMQTLHEAKHIKLHWYSYDNGSVDTMDGGKFDPIEYKENIEFMGDIKFNDYVNKNSLSFPTRWLCQKDYLKECEDSLKAKKDKEEALRIERIAAVASIRSKLTENELKFIRFV